MALADVVVDFAGTFPAASLAAPTVSETVVAPSDRTALLVVIGATATTITIVRSGTDDIGRALVNETIGPLTSTTRLIKLGRYFRDPTSGNTTVQFSQVVAVTACVVRMPV